MHNLFYPGSVMVVGVSAAAGNLGRHIVGNLDRFSFRGPVYAVGREGGELNGRKIHRRIEDVEGNPDLAVFLIPARYVPEALDACGKRGVRYAVIESAGFSEYSEDHRNLEREVLDVARKWDIRFVGPNCISIVNLDCGLALPFVPLDPGDTKKGGISVAAQSGGIVIEILRLLAVENIGFNKLISMGNKLNLDENDYVEYLLSDPGTSVIGLYLENFADGRRLMAAASGGEKPVIVLKANTNPASQTAARFHTSALAGDDAVADAAMAQAGLHRVRNMQEMMDAFKIFSMPLMKGKKLAVLSRSGGQAVLLADAAHRYGFDLVPYSDAFYDVVRKKLRAGVIRMANPLDMGDIFDIDFYVTIMEQALKEKDVDGLIVSHGYVADVEIDATKRLVRAAGELCGTYGKPVVANILPDKKEWFGMRTVTDFPLFGDADFAVMALARSHRHFLNLSKRASRPSPGVKAANPVRRAARAAGRLMEPAEVFGLLESHGVPVAPWSVVKGVKDALKSADYMGYPVALKIASPAVLHKTEAGGVRLNIAGARELEEALGGMKADACLVQKMAPAGMEVIIGGRRDREFGPVILFGLGGIYVEVLKDVAMRVAPVSEAEAREMVAEIKGAALLRGFRGKGPYDVDALVKCLCGVSTLLAENPGIENIDMNPLVVFEKGKGCMAVDAKVEAVWETEG